MAGKRIDEVEKEKRIHQISLMLRRKPVSFLLDYIRRNWGIERTQAFRYIKLAREEWQKHSASLRYDGMSYHLAQLRDLKDQAYSKKVVVGPADNKQVINIPDLGLVFDIAKEEAKLMGMYIDRKEVGEPGSFAEWVKEVKKEKERRRKENSKPNR